MTDIVPAQAFSPGEFLRDELEARDWTQAEFAQMIGRPPRLVSEIIAGKRGITPETAHAFAAAFGTTAQLWMNLDAAYQLSLVAPETERISREAALRERFPVREMQKRGWIPVSKNFDEIEQSVFGYFGISAANDQIALPHAARRNHDEKLTVIQWAWIFRVNQLATALQAPAYSETSLRAACADLERLMTEPEEARHIPKILTECGVRFVVVEPIPGSKIGGVCFWIKDNTVPVIGLSLKDDLIDRFWFTLWHEIEHVLRGDGKGSVIVDEFDDHTCNTEAAEKAADESASNKCVPTKPMKDFIARHSPMFSEKNLIGFARLMKRHPGIVAGQIQRHTGRWELFKKHQPRVRQIITETALTDGYGRHGPNL